MNWEEVVEAGRRLSGESSRVSWELGDLAVQAVRTWPGGVLGRNGVRPKIQPALQALAEECDLDFSVVANCFYTSRAWPKSKRKKASHSAHRVLMGHDDRFTILRDGMTQNEAIRQAGKTWRRTPALGPRTIADGLEALSGAVRFSRLADNTIAACLSDLSASEAAVVIDRCDRIRGHIGAIEDAVLNRSRKKRGRKAS